MYRKIALKLTNLFVEKRIILKDKQDIYAYGFEMMISSFVYFGIFIFFAAITNTIFQSLLFWMGLFISRKITGGHHANSYISCHILFAINHIICILLVKITPSLILYEMTLSMLVITLISVFLFAPVDHKNKRFIKNEYKRYKFLSKVYSVALTLILILFLIKIIPTNTFFYAYSIGIFSAAISLLCGKIYNFERNQKQ